MSYGWISIHRQLQSHWLWDDKPFSRGQAWIDLLLLANHTDNTFLLGNELFEVQTGSFITSVAKLCNRWGWSNTKVVKFLELLESDGMLTKKSDTKKTVITIVKYGDYQMADDTKTIQKRRKNDTKTIRKHTNNNDNNDNNENNVIYVDNAELNQAIISFVAFREKIKKPMTEHAVGLLVTKLNKMTPDVQKQIEIINQSIINGWQGVFPLNEGNQNKQTKSQPKFNNFNQRKYDYDAVERALLSRNNPPKPETDPEFLREAEALKKELQEKY